MNWTLLFVTTYGWCWLGHVVLFTKLFRTAKSYNPWLYIPFACLCAGAWPFFMLMVLGRNYVEVWREFFGIEEE